MNYNPFETIETRLNSIETMLHVLTSNQQCADDAVEPAADLLNVQQAADFLSLKVPTIYSMACRGQLPVMKRSKRIYFSKSELMSYLKDGRKQTADEREANAGDLMLHNKNRS